MLLLLLCASTALQLQQQLTVQRQHRCCGPRAAVPEVEETASLEVAAVQAEVAAARIPAAMALSRGAADAEVTELQASGDARLIEILGASQADSGSGDVLRALRKPAGTIAIVAEGVPVRRRTVTELGAGTGRSGWLEDDLADATWLSEQFRLGGAAAVCE